MQPQNLKAILEKVGTLEKTLTNFLSREGNVASTQVITNVEYMQTHTALYTILHSGNDKDAGKNVLEVFKENMAKFVRNVILPSLSKQHGEELFDKFVVHWDNYKIFANWFKKLFMLIDQNHLPPFRTTLSNIAYEIFANEMSSFMSTQLFDEIYNFLTKERKRDVIPRSKLKKLIQIYTILSYKTQNLVFITEKRELVLQAGGLGTQFYTNNFENLLAQRIQNDYHIRASQEIQALSVPEYNNLALELLKFEEEQASFYYAQSKKLIISVIEAELITKNVSPLIENQTTGMVKMIDTESMKDLSNFYRLLHRGDMKNIKDLAVAFGDKVEKIGTHILQERKKQEDFDQIEFINDAFNYKRKIDRIAKDAFENSMDFQQKRDEGFKKLLKNFEEFPRYLANYMDYQFTEGIKGKENETEELIMVFTKLFVYLGSKDVFVSSYHKQLAQRLLNDTSLSTGAEKDLVTKLANECGKAEVIKFETMFTDIETTKDLHSDFEKIYKVSPMVPIVLTSWNWPNMGEGDITKMPEELFQPAKDFEFYFKGKSHVNASKVLRWILTEGKIVLDIKAPGGKIALEVKTHHACILLLFNKEKRIKYGQIKALTNMKPDVLEKHIKFLTAQPSKTVPILLRTTQDPAIGDNEEIEFNENFKHAKKRIVLWSGKINWRNVKASTTVVNKGENTDIEKQREFIVDSVAVRVMKSRRTIPYNDAISEIISLITMFQPDPKFIKKRIESLIEREFIKRSEGDQKLLIYVP
jgi:hypothetical protein